jgi:tRNA isopentenyl-2-thiomethyl-A-37 hydroxylase MiaE
MCGLLKMRDDLKHQIEELNNGIKHINGVIDLLNNDIKPKQVKNLIFKHNECKLMLLDMLRNAASQPLDFYEVVNGLIKAKNLDYDTLNMNNFKKTVRSSLDRLTKQGLVQIDAIGRWFI